MQREDDFQVRSWVVVPASLRITKNEQVVKLEPLAMAVLVYLAKNAGQTISREELSREVWQRNLVTDQAINRIVAGLRKLLGDDVSQPRYIETIPKRGYRLIAPVTFIAHENSLKSKTLQTDTRSDHPSSRKKLYLWGAIASLVVVFWVTGIIRNNSAIDNEGAENDSQFQKSPAIREIKRATILLGNESEPDFSPDGRYLVYKHRAPDSDYWQIAVTDLYTNRNIHLTDTAHHNREPRWSPSGDWLVFHRYNENECGIHRIHVGGAVTALPISEKIISCHLTSLRVSVTWSLDEQFLYYTDSESNTSPYQIHRYEFGSGKTQVLSEPPAGGRGDYLIRTSHAGEHLLVLRNQRWSDTDILIYHIESAQFKHVDSVLEVLLSADWGRNDTDLLLGKLTGKLELLNLASLIRKPVYHSASSLYAPTSVPNSRDIAFVQGSDTVTNIYEVSLGNSDQAMRSDVLIESSSQDTLPTYANHSNKMVFISDRTGIPQIWLREENGSLQQLTYLEEVRSIGLHWSPDDKYLIFESMAGLYLTDFTNRTTTRLTDENELAYNPSWSADSQSVIYAAEKSGDWQLSRLDINSGQRYQITTNGGYCSVSDTTGRFLYLLKYDEPGIWRFDLSSNQETLIIKDDLIGLCLSLNTRNSLLYYSINDTENRPIMVWDSRTGQSTRLIQRNSLARYHFSVSSDSKHIAYTSRTQSESAIAILRH